MDGTAPTRYRTTIDMGSLELLEASKDSRIFPRSFSASVREYVAQRLEESEREPQPERTPPPSRPRRRHWEHRVAAKPRVPEGHDPTEHPNQVHAGGAIPPRRTRRGGGRDRREAHQHRRSSVIEERLRGGALTTATLGNLAKDPTLSPALIEKIEAELQRRGVE